MHSVQVIIKFVAIAQCQVVNVKTSVILINISCNTASHQSSKLNPEMECNAAILHILFHI